MDQDSKDQKDSEESEGQETSGEQPASESETLEHQDTDTPTPSDLSDLSEESEHDIPRANPQRPRFYQTESDSDQPPIEKKNRTLFWIGSLGVVVILLASGFFLYQFLRQSPKQETVSPVEEEEVEQVEESPQPTFSRADWSLEVLNGTGVTGAAKKVADKLKELGYQVVKVGNADKDTYEGNHLLVAKDKQDQSEQLLEDLNKELKIASVSGELKDSTASARIILGKE